MYKYLVQIFPQIPLNLILAFLYDVCVTHRRFLYILHPCDQCNLSQWNKMIGSNLFNMNFLCYRCARDKYSNTSNSCRQKIKKLIEEHNFFNKLRSLNDPDFVYKPLQSFN